MFDFSSYLEQHPVVLAPMAGVTDLPFRRLCRRLGAGLVVSEMVSANPALRQTRKTQLRLCHEDEPSPRIVQIAGGDAEWLADCAQFNVDQGAEIIDINMGCPAKKVCKKAAGSALLKDERLVAKILESVVNAVEVPVTLKIRTGWDRENKNALNIAKIAESSGVQMLTIHGRTRACRFEGHAEYDTISNVVESVSIPVVANGDITSNEQAQMVLKKTKANAVMIGRAAMGNPWIFKSMCAHLKGDTHYNPPALEEKKQIMQEHLSALGAFYGDQAATKIARKHVKWFLQAHSDVDRLWSEFHPLTQLSEQINFFI